MLFLIGPLKKTAQPIAKNGSQKDSQHNGNRNIQKISRPDASPLGHAQKGGKQHNHKNIVAGSPRHNHLGDTLIRTVFFLHQLNHPRNDHCR